MPKLTEVNCETGEVIEREMTENDKTIYEEMIAVLDTEPTEQEILKQSAKNKLAALGLSEEEIQALIG